MSVDVGTPESLERHYAVPTTTERMPHLPLRQLALDQAAANVQGDMSVQWAMPTVTAQGTILIPASVMQEALPPVYDRTAGTAYGQQEAMPPVIGQ